MKEEEIDHEQLVRAFLLICHWRGLLKSGRALYYTDREKGLRIYPSGLVSLLFQGWKGIWAIFLSHALQKCRVYVLRGWPSDTYLEEVENREEKLQAIVGTIYDGLAFKGEQTGCEMEINDQGVSFYRRNICLAGEDISGKMPFRPYDEAIPGYYPSTNSFKENAPVLLALEPVYYIPPVAGKVEKANLHGRVFSRNGEKYLHWVTLDPL